MNIRFNVVFNELAANDISHWFILCYKFQDDMFKMSDLMLSAQGSLISHAEHKNREEKSSLSSIDNVDNRKSGAIDSTLKPIAEDDPNQNLIYIDENA